MDISSLSSTSYIDTQFSINQQTSDLNSFQSTLDNAMKSQDDDELMSACKEFEAYFLKMMMTEMRKTVDKSDSYIQTSNAESIFQDMLDEEMTNSMASSGSGIGLADMMYRQMSINTTNSVDFNA